MNIRPSTNLEFPTAAHCEAFADSLAAYCQQQHLSCYDDSQLRLMIWKRLSLPYVEHELLALTLLRELQRRLEVRELEAEHGG